ncbi:hypothetical protein ACHAXR_003853, partial [Thalassiosira sp. AJA248-18]
MHRLDVAYLAAIASPLSSSSAYDTDGTPTMPSKRLRAVRNEISFGRTGGEKSKRKRGNADNGDANETSGAKIMAAAAAGKSATTKPSKKSRKLSTSDDDDWTADEDATLKKLMAKGKSWNVIASLMQNPTATRSAIQCRKRWLSHHTKLKWTIDEDDKIHRLQQQLGNKWTRIAKELGTGRSDNDVKNHFYSGKRTRNRRAASQAEAEREAEMNSNDTRTNENASIAGEENGGNDDGSATTMGDDGNPEAMDNNNSDNEDTDGAISSTILSPLTRKEPAMDSTGGGGIGTNSGTTSFADDMEQPAKMQKTNPPGKAVDDSNNQHSDHSGLNVQLLASRESSSNTANNNVDPPSIDRFVECVAAIARDGFTEHKQYYESQLQAKKNSMELMLKENEEKCRENDRLGKELNDEKEANVEKGAQIGCIRQEVEALKKQLEEKAACIEKMTRTEAELKEKMDGQSTTIEDLKADLAREKRAHVEKTNSMKDLLEKQKKSSDSAMASHRIEKQQLEDELQKAKDKSQAQRHSSNDQKQRVKELELKNEAMAKEHNIEVEICEKRHSE